MIIAFMLAFLGLGALAWFVPTPFAYIIGLASVLLFVLYVRHMNRRHDRRAGE
jgi:uncharacterized membrane protein